MYPEHCQEWLLDEVERRMYMSIFIRLILTSCLIPSGPNFDLSDHNIDGWHTATDAAKSALDALRSKGTHSAVPLPAFYRSNRGPRHDGVARGTDDWILIRPADYVSELRGALVEITFNLIHHPIRGPRETKDVWNARVVQIKKLKTITAPQVVIAPASSPNKRKNLSAVLGGGGRAGPSASSKIRRIY